MNKEKQKKGVVVKSCVDDVEWVKLATEKGKHACDYEKEEEGEGEEEEEEEKKTRLDKKHSNHR